LFFPGVAIGAAKPWRLSRLASGHIETAAMRAELVGLREWLLGILEKP
jgi:hypothetical protein